MRLMLDTVAMDGVVVIGEGEKDEAPMLYNGEQIGNGQPPQVDVAVDPLEGTRLTSPRPAERDRGDRGRRARDDVLPGRASTWTSWPAAPRSRMSSTSPRLRRRTCVAPPRRKGVEPSEISVVVLDRERNTDLIAGLREAGARVNLITDGDVAPALAAARPAPRSTCMMGSAVRPKA